MAAAEAMKEEDITEVVSLSDDEESIMEAGGILYREECVRQVTWTGRPNTLNITKNSVAPP